MFDLPLPDADDHAALVAALAAIEAEMAAPATQEQCDAVSRLLGQLALLFPHARMSIGEARAQNRLYADLLADIPLAMLEPAFRACAQSCRFFPSVAELRTAAAPALNMRSWRRMRMRVLLLRARRER